MPPKRNTPASSLDLSGASPVIQSSTNIGNDPGSTTKGVGTGLKSKRQPLVRSGGSGSNSGSQQSLLGFSSKKNTPVTPEKKKRATGGLKRKAEEVEHEVEDSGTTLHPMFAAARKGDEPTTIAKPPVQTIDLDSNQDGVRSVTIDGVSGVPTDHWDPLLLSYTGSTVPTKEMERNLTLDNVHESSLDLTPGEQVEETDDIAPGKRRIRGLAVRKAMLEADQRIKSIRLSKPSVALGKGKTVAGTKGKAGVRGKETSSGGLNPNDKKWSKVYKEAWKAMGGDFITPSKSPRTYSLAQHAV